MKTRILFVCTGNIIRSKLAEAYLRRIVNQAGLNERFEIDSAGTGGWHVGEGPDSRMVRTASRHGWTYGGSARALRRDDLERFDVILAADHGHRATLLSMARTPQQQAKIHMMCEFDPLSNPQDEVPDPYYGGLDGFEETYQIVVRSCTGLLDALVNERIAFQPRLIDDD